MTTQDRQPAGVPAGGQFAATARAETTTVLPDPPKPVGDLGITVGDSLFMSPFEAGTDIFSEVEIVHDEDGYRVEGAMGIDFIDGYHETFRSGPGPCRPYTDEQVAEAVAWLDDHQQIVERFFTDRYGCEFDRGCDEWAHQRAQFSVELNPAVDTRGSAASQLENGTKAIALYNESDAGTYGSDYMWSALNRHMQNWEQKVTHAQQAYTADVLEDSGIPYGEALGHASQMTRPQLEKQAAPVRRFMMENHDLITQAEAHWAEKFGSEYTPELIGRDISLAMHNPPGTPHGRLAFGAVPSHLGERLAAAARACNS